MEFWIFIRNRNLILLVSSFAAVNLFAVCADDVENETLSRSYAKVYHIVAGANDAEESLDGRVNLTSTDIEMGEDELQQVVGLRFTRVDIPRGARLKRAYLKFTVDEASVDTASLNLYTHDIGNAPVFSRSIKDISMRHLSSVSVDWTPGPWEKNTRMSIEKQSPNITSILQPIINRQDWIPGNAVAFIITGRGKRVAETFEGSVDDAPRLHVEYLLDASFELSSFTPSSQRVEVGEQVSFSWTAVYRNEINPNLNCQLKLDRYSANSGSETIHVPTDCYNLRQNHVFSEPGYYTVQLSVSDGANKQLATTDLWVSTPASAVLVAAGDISCDPNSNSFNSGEGTANNCRMKATSDLVIDQNPDAVAVLGDIQYENGAYQKFLDAYDPTWGRFKTITYPAVGNHEYLVPQANGYYRYFGTRAGEPDKGYYSYDLGAWHIVVLNSNCTFAGGCGRGSLQEQWLRKDLKDNPNVCTLAYWHHPLFSSGEIGSIDWTSTLWNVLLEAGAELVLTGHDHHYERFAPQTSGGTLDYDRGMQQFVIGGGGKNHTDILERLPNSLAQHSGTFGVLRLNLHSRSYDWEFIGEHDNSFRDSGNGSCD